jgi:hypothetical protein
MARLRFVPIMHVSRFVFAVSFFSLILYSKSHKAFKRRTSLSIEFVTAITMTTPFASSRNNGGRRSRNCSSSNTQNDARNGPLWEYLSYVSARQRIQAYFDAETVMEYTNHRQTAHQKGSCPPASFEAISSLPSVRVLPIDKIAGKNDKAECGICCERLVDGVALTRLPCGHVFHITCSVKWLSESCTCPECRYELPTRDPVYEIGRLERMKNRKTFACSCKPCSYHTCFFDANHVESVKLALRATVVPTPAAEELSSDEESSGHDTDSSSSSAFESPDCENMNEATCCYFAQL